MEYTESSYTLLKCNHTISISHIIARAEVCISVGKGEHQLTVSENLLERFTKCLFQLNEWSKF